MTERRAWVMSPTTLRSIAAHPQSTRAMPDMLATLGINFCGARRVKFLGYE